MKMGCTICGHVSRCEGEAEKHFAETHQDEVMTGADLEVDEWEDFHRAEGVRIRERVRHG